MSIRQILRPLTFLINHLSLIDKAERVLEIFGTTINSDRSPDELKITSEEMHFSYVLTLCVKFTDAPVYVAARNAARCVSKGVHIPQRKCARVSGQKTAILVSSKGALVAHQKHLEVPRESGQCGKMGQ